MSANDSSLSQPSQFGAARAEQFKNRRVFAPDELRRRRQDQQVELRKQKREESLAKRRNVDLVDQSGDDSDEEAGGMGTGAADMQVSLVNDGPVTFLLEG